MERENEKIISVNENENKGNKNVDDFQEYFLQHKQANIKVKTQSNMYMEYLIINLPLIKLVRSRWLYGILASVSFHVFVDLIFNSGLKNIKENLANIQPS